MLIRKDICVGCGRCHPYCPAEAISFEELKSAVDQEKCYECGTCLRSQICPVEAIEESPNVYEYPRALRKYFSDPNATNALTGIAGRVTEESKTNDVTNRVGPGQVGIAIEVGRPTIGMDLTDVQKITRAMAKAGITAIEPENPFNDLIQDHKTGDLKPELMSERVLSAIMEIKVERSQLLYPSYAERGGQRSAKRLLRGCHYPPRTGVDDSRRSASDHSGRRIYLASQCQKQPGPG